MTELDDRGYSEVWSVDRSGWRLAAWNYVWRSCWACAFSRCLEAWSRALNRMFLHSAMSSLPRPWCGRSSW